MEDKMEDRKWGICRNNEIISTDYRSLEEYVDSIDDYGNYSEIGNHNEIDLVEIYQLPMFACRRDNDNSTTSWSILWW